MTKRPHKLIFPLLLSFSLLLVSCGSGGGGGTVADASRLTDSQTFSSAEKAFVNDLFHTEYLWFNDVADVEYNAYDAPQALINALRVPDDKWSFTLTQAQYEDMVNQKTAGFGFGYKSDFTIYMVRIDSPAWDKLQRGDKILEINGAAVTNETIAAASNNLGVATTFKVLRVGEGEKEIVITAQEYSFKVTQGKVINSHIGYLRYDSFTSASVAEFEAEFTKFKHDNITDLIIDLRYNSGGSVDVASTLLDNLVIGHEGERQVYLDWNVNYQSKNSTYTFDEDEANDLDMTRMIFLVTKNSASASEMVISALTPYLGKTNVVTIGDTTHGKPVGMNGRTYGSNFYFLINFFVRNNDGETTSLDGIPVTCTAEDDLTHQLGDPAESMLKTAVDYIGNNYACP